MSKQIGRAIGVVLGVGILFGFCAVEIVKDALRGEKTPQPAPPVALTDYEKEQWAELMKELL